MIIGPKVRRFIDVPATEKKIEATCKVMGGNDWECWIEQLLALDV
jgi:trans-2-enoyl-CoA reductase